MNIYLKNNLYILIIIATAISSCSSPQKLYEKGKYFKAYDSVLGDLNGGKKDRKLLLLLNKSFTKMMDVARSEMYILNDGYQVNDLSHNFKQYHEVDKRFVKGKSYIDDENKTKYVDFNTEREDLVMNTYEEGKALLLFYEESNNKIDAKNAYYHFEFVNEYGYGYRDIDQLLYDAKELATVIYNVEADLDSDFSYQYDVDRQFDDLEGENGFVKIVYDNNFINGDCNIQLDFSRLDVDESSSQTSQNFSNEILDGYKTEIDTSGNSTQVPIYKVVSGRVTTKTIIKTVAWRIDIEIVNASRNCDLREERFTASVEDRVEIYEYDGDQRAIPDEYKNTTNGVLEDTDDMVDDLIEELYRKVRNYFF